MLVDVEVSRSFRYSKLEGEDLTGVKADNTP